MANIVVSKAHLTKAQERINSLQNRIAKFRDHAEKTTEKVVRSVEVGASALTVGIIQGRVGSVEVMGVPFELGAGVALNLLGYFGAAGKFSDHLCNLGDGALASYLTTVGKGVGTAMKVKSLGGGSPAQVNAPAKGRLDLTPDEVAQALGR